MGRKPSSTMQGLKKGSWSEEEDRILFDFVRQHGERDWHSLPQRAGLLRCGKSCRLRWANYLRPGIRRGDFSHEEEETIIRLQASLGNRWATIARHLYRRTDNEIKNYWNTRLKRRAAKSCTTITCVDRPTSEQNSITPTDSTSHTSCPKHNTENTSEQGLNQTAEVTNINSCASTTTSTTTIISEFDQPNSGPTISSSARLLNRIASHTRILDLRRILINDVARSMAHQTTVSPSNTNELMFKRRMELWQSFDREDCDLEEYFFSK